MAKHGINIVVLGKTGVGKSSFCNYIFGEDKFTEGVGKPVTSWSEHFSFHSIDYENFVLNIYDSVGIEVDNLKEWNKRLEELILNLNKNPEAAPMEWVHGFFYLVSAVGARVDPVEIEIINNLIKQNIPLSIILTNSDTANKSEINSLKETLRKGIVNDVDIHEVCSVNIKRRTGTSEKYGKKDVLDSLIKNLEKKLSTNIWLYFLERLDTQLYDMKRQFATTDLDIKETINEFRSLYRLDLNELNNFLTHLAEGEYSSTTIYLDNVIDEFEKLFGLAHDIETPGVLDGLSIKSSGYILPNSMLLAPGVGVISAATMFTLSKLIASKGVNSKTKEDYLTLLEKLCLPAEQFLLMEIYKIRTGRNYK